MLSYLDLVSGTMTHTTQIMTQTNCPRSGILAGGNWIVDQVKLIDAWPQPATLANIVRQYDGTGGSPYNVLLGLAKLGVSFPLVGAGLVGMDAAGSHILSNCRVHNIATPWLGQTAAAPTSYTDVMTEQSTGRRTFFHCRASNALWDGRDIDFETSSARIFHLGYLLLLDALDQADAQFGTTAARLLAKAQAAGLKTSIDTVSEISDRFAAVMRPALRYTDYCILNEIEAEQICQIATRDGSQDLRPEGVRMAAKAILDYGVRELCVIHFPEGAYALNTQGQECWQNSLQLPPEYIAGSAGAGDALCAGVLLGLHEGWALQRCMLTGVCAAAASLADPTCTAGIGSLEECLALAQTYGLRNRLA